MPENEDAFLVWQEIRTQWRAGPMGILGLDYAEARQAARELEIEWSIGLKRKIQALEGHTLRQTAPRQ